MVFVPVNQASFRALILLAKLAQAIARSVPVKLFVLLA